MVYIILFLTVLGLFTFFYLLQLSVKLLLRKNKKWPV